MKSDGWGNRVQECIKSMGKQSLKPLVDPDQVQRSQRVEEVPLFSRRYDMIAEKDMTSLIQMAKDE